MVARRKKINRQKRQLSQLSETLNDFIIVKNSKIGVTENGKLKQQAIGRH